MSFNSLNFPRPMWFRYPDFDSARWLNRVIDVRWAQLLPVVNDHVLKAMQVALTQNPGFWSLRVEWFDMGARAFVIDGIKVGGKFVDFRVLIVGASARCSETATGSKDNLSAGFDLSEISVSLLLRVPLICLADPTRALCVSLVEIPERVDWRGRVFQNATVGVVEVLRRKVQSLLFDPLFEHMLYPNAVEFCSSPSETPVTEACFVGLDLDGVLTQPGRHHSFPSRIGETSERMSAERTLKVSEESQRRRAEGEIPSEPNGVEEPRNDVQESRHGFVDPKIEMKEIEIELEDFGKFNKVEQPKKPRTISEKELKEMKKAGMKEAKKAKDAQKAADKKLRKLQKEPKRVLRGSKIGKPKKETKEKESKEEMEKLAKAPSVAPIKFESESTAKSSDESSSSSEESSEELVSFGDERITAPVENAPPSAETQSSSEPAKSPKSTNPFDDDVFSVTMGLEDILGQGAAGTLSSNQVMRQGSRASERFAVEPSSELLRSSTSPLSSRRSSSHTPSGSRTDRIKSRISNFAKDLPFPGGRTLQQKSLSEHNINLLQSKRKSVPEARISLSTRSSASSFLSIDGLSSELSPKIVQQVYEDADVWGTLAMKRKSKWRRSKWKQRKCVMKDGVIYWDKHANRIDGKIDLRRDQCYIVRDDICAFSVRIDEEIHQFRANDALAVQEWVNRARSYTTSTPTEQGTEEKKLSVS
eukprot:895254_1